MKKIQLLSIFALALAGAAHAASDAHQMCVDAKLETLNNEKNNIKKTYSYDLSKKTNEEISNLPSPVKQHLIIVAKDAIKAGYQPSDKKVTEADIDSAVAAVKYIRGINESADEELMYTYLQAGTGAEFSEVTYYPGAQVGTIFLRESNTRVATVNDSTVNCVK